LAVRVRLLNISASINLAGLEDKDMSSITELSDVLQGQGQGVARSEPVASSAVSVLRRLAIPVAIVGVALAFVGTAVVRWDAWAGERAIQVTNDAYVRAETTRLSVRVAGAVKTVAVRDYQRVRAGDLLVEIDPADYAVQVLQAEAVVAAARAAMDNLGNQVELQYATIAQAEAQLQSASARETQAGQEEERQETLSLSNSGTRQRLEQAVADYAKAQADVRASRAVIAAQKHQLGILAGTRKQREADVRAAEAALDAARLRLSYTRVVAPFDGSVGERQVQMGDYVNIGTNLIAVVPLPNVYVTANYKETQLTNVKVGQPVEITVDTFPGAVLRGRVEQIAPASGSQFALLPPDNATGNFTKVVQRIPVRIALDSGQPRLADLRPGMSVVTRIHADVTR
jgi:membrane fusion protein (multidrug efflux system)